MQNQLYIKRNRLYIQKREEVFCWLSWRCQKLGDNEKCIEMKKCAVLFLVLVVALIFAAVSEGKDVKLKSDWDKVVAKK